MLIFVACCALGWAVCFRRWLVFRLRSDYWLLVAIVLGMPALLMIFFYPKTHGLTLLLYTCAVMPFVLYPVLLCATSEAAVIKMLNRKYGYLRFILGLVRVSRAEAQSFQREAYSTYYFSWRRAALLIPIVIVLTVVICIFARSLFSATFYIICAPFSVYPLSLVKKTDEVVPR